ncbi:zinc finger protein 324A-like [Anopheles bellator]|uniref:zinc finger protein 324A-like n=1 Tax=Anopheles bellator TaxID=139047 RepID=UPI002647501B|nr:zinc finger protein 324A-like [Anopheles bellator]
MNLEICRICLSAVDVLFNVHDPLDKDQTMYTVLCSIFPAAFSDETDPNEWPSKLCKKCKRKIMNTHSFYNLCMASHKWWNEQFAEVQVYESAAECIDVAQEVSPNAEPSPCLLPQFAESLNFDAEMYEDWTSEIEPVGKETQEQITQVETIDEILVYEEDTDASCKENTPGNMAPAESLPHLCTFCEEASFASAHDLTSHLLEFHTEKVHYCEPCSVLFLDRKKYQVHQKSHDLGHTYFCGTCEKGFASESKLAKHSKKHAVNHLCSICGKKFSRRQYLTRHMVRHSSARPYACDLCPARFVTQGEERAHNRTVHTETKKFECDLCGTKWYSRNGLKKHRQTHMGERPFSCNLCEWSFTAAHHLKRHMVVHTGERSYKCGFCGKQFAQGSVLVKHTRTHIGENVFPCVHCDASFRLLRDLRNHYKEHLQPADGTIIDSSVAGDGLGQVIRFNTKDALNIRYRKDGIDITN